MHTYHNPSIAIIGAGWLGKPLALHLHSQHYPVMVSCTQQSKAEQLILQGLPAVNVTLSEKPKGDWQTLLHNKNIAICLLPAGYGNHANTPLTQQISNLLALLKKYKVSKLLFISSTGIYQKTDKILTENSALNINSDIANAEQLITTQQEIDYTIIRFAGLISKDRNPTTTLSKKSAQGHIFDAGQSPVNLIHRKDCINIITQVIGQQCWGEIFNACSDSHPSRQQFYQENAKQLGITVPVFNNNNSLPHCIIDNTKLKQGLNYQFLHNSITDLTD